MIEKPVYIIVHESSVISMQESVNDFIENGYLTIGGVSVVYPNKCFFYVQAMILGEYANGK